MDILTKILSAAVEMFRQYGFKTITMDDLARRAGISKKTLYQHFANKNEVIKESVLWYKGRIFESCQQSMDDSANAVEAMVRIMDLLDQMHKHTNPMAILELQRYYPDAYQVFRDNLISQDVEAVKQNILAGIEEGLYRSDINPDLLSRFRIETSLMIFQPNLLVNDRYDLQFVNHELTELFLYGIMTPKGEKLFQKYKEEYLKKVK